MTWKILQGDVIDRLRDIPDESVQCCVTSPPYWSQRDYGVAGQIGMENTPDEHVAKLVEVFREVRRVLRDDGVLWVNYGDAYAGHNPPGWRPGNEAKNGGASNKQGCGYVSGLKPKDLIGLAWMLAFALRADGWWLRSDCIWHKPNPMPESVRDRPTKAHEYVFLLSKSARYFYDAEAIKETATNKAPGNTKPNKGVAEDPVRHRTRAALHTYGPVEKRNLRTVWTMTPDCYPEAHFAVFPEALAERCIMAGSRRGDVVLDPFAGSGTTLAVAERLGRDSIGIELNPAYIAMAERRICAVDPTATVELGNGQQQKSLFGPDQ